MAARGTFDEELNLPVVGLPDWELYAQIEELFRKYGVLTPLNTFHVRGTDRRGTIHAEDVASLRAESEARGTELTFFAISTDDLEPDGRTSRYLAFRQGTTGQPTASISTADAVTTSGLARELQEVMAPAAKRLQEAEAGKVERAAREQEELIRRATGSQPAPQVEAGHSLEFPMRRGLWGVTDAALRHPLVSSVLAGVLAALILGALHVAIGFP